MIVQLLQVRKILESWAAAEASRQATDEDLRALEAVYQDLERDFRNNELGVDADVRFHLSIYQATRNTVLSHVASTLLALLHQAQRITRQVMFEETVNKERLGILDLNWRLSSINFRDQAEESLTGPALRCRLPACADWQSTCSARRRRRQRTPSPRTQPIWEGSAGRGPTGP